MRTDQREPKHIRYSIYAKHIWDINTNANRNNENRENKTST